MLAACNLQSQNLKMSSVLKRTDNSCFDQQLVALIGNLNAIFSILGEYLYQNIADESIADGNVCCGFPYK